MIEPNPFLHRLRVHADQSRGHLWKLAVALLAATLISLHSASARSITGERVAESFALPVLQVLLDAAGETEGKLSRLCEAPSEAALATARDAFSNLVRAWGRVTILRFGPLTSENRFDRLFFWPDPRGIALRQVQQVLAKGAADLSALGEGSVALQGLPALEFVLFGTGASEMTNADDDFRCRMAHAIAANIVSVATETRDSWQADTEFSRTFRAPDPQSDLYRTANEVDVEVIKALTTLFQYVRMAELLPAMGDSLETARGRRAPLWRSMLTFELAAQQLTAANDLLRTAGYRNRLPEERRWVVDTIRIEIETAIRLLSEIESEPQNAFGIPDDRNNIAFALSAVARADTILLRYLTQLLGLYVGFNALEGD
ncbi:MAG: hypothetical protein JJ911_05350 [Rhizobiaceae bacterium]|nr:hypothetical protein [Rhizobiaceae bacterium]